MFGALGIGLVSFPILDVAALTLVQLKLLGRLAKLYDLPFSAQLSKAAIGALVAGGGSVVAARGSGRLVLRLIPAVPGWLVGIASTSAFAGASTYAIGRVFIQHFDSGGTLLTFDPERVRKFYAEAYAQGAGELQASFAGVMP